MNDLDDAHDSGPASAGLRIGEVAQRAGLRTSAIRYYEAIGVLPEPERHAGQRRYDAEVLRELAVVAAARRVGLSLDEVRGLLAASRSGMPIGDTLRETARRRLPEVEALIDHARVVRDWLTAAGTCECLTLDDCALLRSDVAERWP